MKVIFLDMDGVLNNRNSMALSGIFHVGPSLYTVDPTCVKLLECLVAVSKAKIVISSSWRGPTLDTTWNVKEAFEYAGCPELWNEVIDVTPHHQDRFRGREIDDWLKAHPEVTHFVVIDDDSFDITQKDYFVRTESQFGLQLKHIEKAWNILGGPAEMTRTSVKLAVGRDVVDTRGDWVEHCIYNLSRERS